VAVIAWGPWQIEHITRRHGVTAQQFDTAWHDPERRDLAEQRHERHGPYYVSIGGAAIGKPLKMVWRWQRREGTVWPITSFFPPSRRARRR
jgi:hypothetical protein